MSKVVSVRLDDSEVSSLDALGLLWNMKRSDVLRQLIHGGTPFWDTSTQVTNTTTGPSMNYHILGTTMQRVG